VEQWLSFSFAHAHYDFIWRQIGGKLSQNHYTAEKTKIILDIIPDECSTIVDVACGDGAITNVLAEKYEVIGIDLSQVAVNYLSTRTLPTLGSTDYLLSKTKVLIWCCPANYWSICLMRCS